MKNDRLIKVEIDILKEYHKTDRIWWCEFEYNNNIYIGLYNNYYGMFYRKDFSKITFNTIPMKSPVLVKPSSDNRVYLSNIIETVENKGKDVKCVKMSNGSLIDEKIFKLFKPDVSDKYYQNGINEPLLITDLMDSLVGLILPIRQK